ncbi:MAG: ferric reductase-like transmembrane domain-containing protein [Candidatus Diapherotrites archaeon]|nr:ferric reductase-like transmembrane domain-containing protein [Candidatus Diapherotrites archaeon]
MKELKPHLISILVILILSWYYFIYSGRPLALNFVNAVTAFSSTFIIGLSFLWGPLARFIPIFKHTLSYRKPLGLWGFGLAALHVLLVVFVLLGNSREVTFADIVSIGVAAVAFVIFSLMALTSSNEWVVKLGYSNWKSLQRTGYLAFAFVLFHIVLLEKGIFLSRLTGQIAIGFILVIFLLRALVLLFKIPLPEQPMNPTAK